MNKFALIHLGNEESYGLLYAGTELKKYGEIKFFDAEMDNNFLGKIISYAPTHICFSPMTAFYQQAKKIEIAAKTLIPGIISIYGGHHATNCGYDCGDITVVGAVKNLDIKMLGIHYGGPTLPENLVTPAREEYFMDIPRMRNRYRKMMLSVVGCPFSCAYCSSASENTRKLYGDTKSHLVHRNMDDIFREAHYIKDSTIEIEWVDDDVLYGDRNWLMEFFIRWQDEIKLPMYVSTTSISALKADFDLLELMSKTVNCIGLGVQAIRPDSLKLVNRGWDSEKQIKKAYDKLGLFFNVNLQCIVGLPVKDPIEDALDTIDGMVRIGKGSIASCYPMQVYPNTRMERYCKENGYTLNEKCLGDTNSGVPGINFGYDVNKNIVNICKLATMVIKYGIDRKWLISMLDIDLSEASKSMSLQRYYECIKDRLPDNADSIFNTITQNMNVRY
jgi:hypothetical protein